MKRDSTKTEGIGQRIRARRKELGLTLQAVAQSVGVSKAAASQWENGDTNIAADNLLKLALVLRSNPFELMGIKTNAVGHPALDVSRLSPAIETLESFLTRKRVTIEPLVKAKVLSYLCDTDDATSDRELVRLIDLA